MTPARDLHEAICENFHEIMNTTDPEKRRALIDSIWDYTNVIHAVAQAMAEPELAA